MELCEIQKINQARLPKKHQTCLMDEEFEELFYKVKKFWNSGNKEGYCKLSDYVFKNKRHLYYTLFIWYHPLTKFQELAKKVEKLKE